MIKIVTGKPGEGMTLQAYRPVSSICFGYWSADLQPGDAAIDRHDPYYFEHTYSAYESLQLEVRS